LSRAQTRSPIERPDDQLTNGVVGSVAPTFVHQDAARGPGRPDVWHRLSALGCALVVGGCQASPPPAPTEPTTHKTVIHPGDAALSVVGTPIYLVFKSVFCVASVAIAAPVAGIAALSESRFAPAARRDLGDGVSQNCGPPYVLSPYRTGSVNAGPEGSAGPKASPTPPSAAAPEPPAVSTPEEHPAPPTGGPVKLLPDT
jgi:hypothetical protein